MEESRDIHQRLTGRRLRGWFSPAITNTLDTFELAAECGYDYTADLYHDDQPFPLKVKTGRLLSMPYSVDINDVILHRRGLEADDFVRQIRDAFDTLYDEGAEQGRVMCIALHPYWVGQPHRIRAFRGAMEYILSHPGVWLTTAGDVTDWFNAHHLPLIEAHLAAREAANG
jgi:peptidoglycan/xylan/chitin deacetylase (PgdA/CDA1 family)